MCINNVQKVLNDDIRLQHDSVEPVEKSEAYDSVQKVQLVKLLCLSIGTFRTMEIW